MPMLIADSKVREIFQHLENAEENTSLYAELSRHPFIEDVSGFVSVPVPPGFKLIRINARFEDCFEIALMSESESKIVYYNKVNILKDVALFQTSDLRRATQVLVWRSADYEYSSVLSDLPKSVFFDYLLKCYYVVVSDSQQTVDGSRFWGYCLTRALATNLYVYHYNFMHGILSPISTKAQLDTYKSTMWGALPHHEEQLAVISAIQLPA